MMTVLNFVVRHPGVCMGMTPTNGWLAICGPDAPMATAWQRCMRPDWMVMALHAIRYKSFPGPRSYACDCAAHLFKLEKAAGRTVNAKSHNAIATARAYLKGKASLEDLYQAWKMAMVVAMDFRTTFASIADLDDAAFAARDTALLAARAACNQASGAARLVTLSYRDWPWQADRLRRYVPKWPG